VSRAALSTGLARLRSALGRRGLVVAIVVLLSLFLALGAYASGGRHLGANKKASPSASASATQQEEEEPEAAEADATAKFHGDGTTSCDLPDGVTALSENWTHGDYVSAWAKWASDQKQQGLSTEANGLSVRDAAHSPCGKPVTSLSSHGRSGQAHGKSAEAHAWHKP
jgi:hypothetical protein